MGHGILKALQPHLKPGVSWEDFCLAQILNICEILTELLPKMAAANN
jgi:hypothetical protein